MFSCFVASLVLWFSAALSGAAGQEPGTAPQESAQEETVPPEAELPDSALEVDAVDGGPLFRSVRERVSQGDIRDAAALVDDAVAEGTAELRDVFLSRRMIAGAFLRINNPRDAWDQLEKLINHQIESIDDPESSGQIVLALAALSQLSAAIKRTDQAKKLGDATIVALQSAFERLEGDAAIEAREQLSNARIIKSRMLTLAGDAAGAQALLEEDYRELGELRDEDPDSELLLAVYLRATSNLMTSTDDAALKETLYTRHQQVVREKLESEPENLSFAIQYLTVASYRLREKLMGDPAESQAIIDEAREIARKVVEAEASTEAALQAWFARLDQAETVVNGQRRIRELTGTPAPTLEPAAWVNGEEVTAEQRAGSVVLLDFWAAWSGPSVDAMDRYRDLHKEYSGKGLKIIGVTRYFNIDWDFEQQLPRRSEQRVPQEDENEALDLFLEKLGVPWPSMVLENADSLFEDYGVTGLPHSVLIDGEGVIRFIGVGGADETLEQLEKHIDELIE